MATAALTEAESAAAGGAGAPASRGRQSRTVWRRSQRRATRDSCRAQLERCTAKLTLLRTVLSSAGAAGDGVGELGRRLQLVAPVLEARVRGTAPCGLARQRRNAATHNFDVDAQWIARASGTQLNHLQRSGRGETGRDSAAAPGAAGAAGQRVGRRRGHRPRELPLAALLLVVGPAAGAASAAWLAHFAEGTEPHADPRSDPGQRPGLRPGGGLREALRCSEEVREESVSDDSELDELRQRIALAQEAAEVRAAHEVVARIRAAEGRQAENADLTSEVLVLRLDWAPPRVAQRAASFLDGCTLAAITVVSREWSGLFRAQPAASAGTVAACRPGLQDGHGASELAGPGDRVLRLDSAHGVLQVIQIPRNALGWDWRRVCSMWLPYASQADIHEPYLAAPWQREPLVHLVDVLLGVGVHRVRIFTTGRAGDGGHDATEDTRQGLEALSANYRLRGCRVSFELCSFHRRRIVLRYPGRDTAIEVGLDRGLHAWRRPHNEAGRISLAGRRTQDQQVIIRRVLAESSEAPPCHLLPGPVPSVDRARRVLHDIQRLRVQQAAGIPLRPEQERKVQREGALRLALAERQAGMRQIGHAYIDWQCSNPLCSRLNPACCGRCLNRQCARGAPPSLDPWLQQLWRRSVAKRWLWGARTIQRSWRRVLRRRRGRDLAAARIQIAALRWQIARLHRRGGHGNGHLRQRGPGGVPGVRQGVHHGYRRGDVVDEARGARLRGGSSRADPMLLAPVGGAASSPAAHHRPPANARREPGGAQPADGLLRGRLSPAACASALLRTPGSTACASALSRTQGNTACALAVPRTFPTSWGLSVGPSNDDDADEHCRRHHHQHDPLHRVQGSLYCASASLQSQGNTACASALSQPQGDAACALDLSRSQGSTASASALSRTQDDTARALGPALAAARDAPLGAAVNDPYWQSIGAPWPEDEALGILTQPRAGLRRQARLRAPLRHSGTDTAAGGPDLGHRAPGVAAGAVGNEDDDVAAGVPVPDDDVGF